MMKSILEVLDSGDLQEIEYALLDYWRNRRDPTLGDLFEQFCAFAESERSWPGKGAAANEAAQEARFRTDRLSRVLEWLRRQPSDIIARELPLLHHAYGRDPRFTTFAGGILQNPPAKRHASVHVEAFNVLRSNGDVRAQGWVESLIPASEWGNVYEEGGFVRKKDGFGKVFNQHLEAVGALVQGWPDQTLLPATLRELSHALERFITSHHRGKQAAGIPKELLPLFENIVKRPRDLGRRQIFADRASELGHLEWGEFVSLQLRDAEEPLSRSLRGRMKLLLKKNRRTWLGALDTAVGKKDVVMANGFPRAVTIGRTTKKRLRESVSALGWRTVEDLTIATAHADWMDVIAGVPGFHTLRGNLLHLLPVISEEFNVRIQTLDLCHHSKPLLGPVAVAPGLSFPLLRVLRLTQRDLRVLDSLLPQLERPLRRLRLEVRARSVAGNAEFVYTPEQAWEWVLKYREHCTGRTELAIQHGDSTLLEVQVRKKDGAWQMAVGVGQFGRKLDALLERLPRAEIKAVKRLPDGDPDWFRAVRERLT